MSSSVTGFAMGISTSSYIASYGSGTVCGACGLKNDTNRKNGSGDAAKSRSISRPCAPIQAVGVYWYSICARNGFLPGRFFTVA